MEKEMSFSFQKAQLWLPPLRECTACCSTGGLGCWLCHLAAARAMCPLNHKAKRAQGRCRPAPAACWPPRQTTDPAHFPEAERERHPKWHRSTSPRPPSEWWTALPPPSPSWQRWGWQWVDEWCAGSRQKRPLTKNPPSCSKTSQIRLNCPLQDTQPEAPQLSSWPR